MLIRLTLVFCGVLLLWATAATAAEPFPTQSLPGVDIGDGLGSGYETSGVVWHSRLARLFTVDDGGTMSSLDTVGNNVAHWNVGGDLEGITVVDPNTDLIYVGRERDNHIVEYDFVDSEALRVFDLSPWMTSTDNSGLESLTFVSDPDDPEGGLFYAGQQSDGVIYAFRLPIASSPTSNTVSFQFSFQAAPGRTDLSGLHYDAANDVLYAIWDSSNLIRAMRPDGTFLEEWVLPGTNQEGVTFQEANLHIAQDNGPDVIRYPTFPLIVPEPHLGDANSDGRIDGLDYLVWASFFGDDPAQAPPGSPQNGDFNDDGKVDGLDYLLWAGNFGMGPNDNLAVPEPTTLMTLLFSLALVAAGGRRRSFAELRRIFALSAKTSHNGPGCEPATFPATSNWEIPTEQRGL